MSKLKITKDLAYLLGAFKDGAVYKNAKEGIYRIRIYQKYKEWLISVQQIFEKIFNEELYLRKDPRKELWYLEINSKNLFDTLVNLLSQAVPSSVKNASLEIQKSFIQGVFDAEGGIMRIENYENDPKKLKKKLSDIRVRFGQANKELLQFIKEMLEKIGISCGQICGPFYKTKKSEGYYELNSYGIENLKKFILLISSRHPIKIERMSKIVHLA
ncbi:MAG: LAGLIDADG family homing endonuclease [Candidatus Aenigmatarchaeota archaeon]